MQSSYEGSGHQSARDLAEAHCRLWNAGEEAEGKKEKKGLTKNERKKHVSSLRDRSGIAEGARLSWLGVFFGRLGSKREGEERNDVF